ncbi:MAG TPA: sialidase family protein [Gallionella sp.]
MTALPDGYARRALLPALLVLAFGAAFYKVARHPVPARFQWPNPDMEVVRAAPVLRTHFVSQRQNISTHAASLVELGDGRLRAFWFAGSKEGAADVEIRTAVFDPSSDSWSAETGVTERMNTQRALLRFVKKIGNPVPYRAADGTLWLFYVTVTLGGWAGSSITAIISRDDGTTWEPARRLITSPFLNISTLVKGTPFSYADGTIGLPVYHEFIGKFGELLRLSPSGAVLDKQRLSSGRSAIQPVLLVKDQQQAIILMRHTGATPKRVIATSTYDAGMHWSTPEKTALPNPDAAVAGVALPDGRLLLALNDTETNREVLSLTASSDGGATWQTLMQLEDQRNRSAGPETYMQRAAKLALQTEPEIANPAAFGASARLAKCHGEGCGFEFSYPYLIHASNGEFHLVYTWNRSFIKHVRFTSAWLGQRIRSVEQDSPNDSNMEVSNAALH